MKHAMIGMIWFSWFGIALTGLGMWVVKGPIDTATMYGRINAALAIGGGFGWLAALVATAILIEDGCDDD